MWRSLIALIALLLLICGVSHAAEQALLKVFLNDDDKGDYTIIITEKGRFLISRKDMMDLGFKEVPPGVKVGEKGYIYIDSISGAKVALDDKTSSLHIVVDPALLKKSTLDLMRKAQGKVLYTKDTSGFLNYSIYYAGNDLDFGSVSVPLELGVQGGSWLGLSDFTYSKTSGTSRFVRLLTNITHDDQAGHMRLQAGDIYASSGGLGSSEVLGGIGMSTNFSMDPFFIKYPSLPNVSGMLDRPSDVEIFENNILIRKYSMPPGPFEFQNLPNVAGKGDVTVVVKDAFGNEQTYKTPYYISTSLLAPGLQQYSYSLGFRREGLGLKSFDYRSPAFLGFHSLGITRFLTAGFRAEADKDVINAGPTATFLLDGIGTVNASLALSRSQGRTGDGFSANYTYAGKYLSGFLSMQSYSRQYTNIALGPLSSSSPVSDPKFEGSGGVGFGSQVLGSFSVSYSLTKMYQGQNSRMTSVFYSRPLSRAVSFDASAETTKAGTRTYEIHAGLTFILGRETVATTDYDKQNGSSTETISLQKSPPRGEGFGYSVSASKSQDNPDSGSGSSGAMEQGFLEYRGAYGVYSGTYMSLAGQHDYTLSASGAISFINHYFHLSRPITDSFALVKVDNLSDVRVNFSNVEIGKTGGNGELLVPDLLSYYPGKISINENDIPVNYAISELSKLVVVPYRGGGVVKFDLSKIQAFTGRLYIAEKGTKTPAEYWGLKVHIDGHVIETVVGRKGEFYIENVSPGRHRARLFNSDEKKECVFDLAIPKSDDAMVDMGEVDCEME